MRQKKWDGKHNNGDCWQRHLGRTQGMYVNTIVGKGGNTQYTRRGSVTKIHQPKGTLNGGGERGNQGCSKESARRLQHSAAGWEAPKMRSRLRAASRICS